MDGKPDLVKTVQLKAAVNGDHKHHFYKVSPCVTGTIEERTLEGTQRRWKL